LNEESEVKAYKPVPSIRLDVCCNNPDNGLFAGRADGLQVTTWDNQDIEFERTGRAPNFHEKSGQIRIARHWWPYVRSTDWFGNWCWNAYWIETAVIIRLLATVKATRLFDCTLGSDTLFDNWNDKEKPLDETLWAANLWGRHSIGIIDNSENLKK
jgi:hypothetical protein